MVTKEDTDQSLNNQNNLNTLHKPSDVLESGKVYHIFDLMLQAILSLSRLYEERWDSTVIEGYCYLFSTLSTFRVVDRYSLDSHDAESMSYLLMCALELLLDKGDSDSEDLLLVENYMSLISTSNEMSKAISNDAKLFVRFQWLHTNVMIRKKQPVEEITAFLSSMSYEGLVKLMNW